MDDIHHETLKVAALGWTSAAVGAIVQSLDVADDIEVIGATHEVAELTDVLGAADVILLDHRLPQKLAARILYMLDSPGYELNAIVVNVPEDDPGVIIRYMEGGAMGYLRTDEPVSQLPCIIRSVACGRARLDAPVAGPLLARMNDLRWRVQGASKIEQISDPYVVEADESVFVDSPGSKDDRLELEIASTECLERAAQVALDYLCSTFDKDVGQVYFRQPKCDVLVPLEFRSQLDVRPCAEFGMVSGNRRVKAGAGCVGQVYLTGKALWSTRIQGLADFRRATSASKCGLRSILVAPITVRDTVVGALELFDTDESAPSLALLETLAISGAQLGRRFSRQLGPL